MKKREDLIVKKILNLLAHLHYLIEEFAALKMKNESYEVLSLQEEKILRFSKEICGYIDLFGFTLNDFLELTPKFLATTLEYAFNRVSNDIREKQLIRKHVD